MTNSQYKVKAKKFRFSRVLVILLLLTVLGALVAEIMQPRLWLDFVNRQNYTPDQQVLEITGKIRLTSSAENLFLSSRPSVELADQFNSYCESHETSIAILGCYDDDRIFVYNITEPKLSGVMETTAAHELLHAAYARLNFLEKDKIDQLINQNYDSIKDDDLEKRLEYYKRNDPSSITNELHSILGTEVENLSSELEEYYSRYFLQRKVVLGFFNDYRSQFDSLRERAEHLKSEISQLEKDLRQSEATYEVRLSELNNDIAIFNKRVNEGYYHEERGFMADRRLLLQRSQSINSERDLLTQKIKEINQLIEEYNSNATQYSQLSQSLDSHSLSPAPTL